MAAPYNMPTFQSVASNLGVVETSQTPSSAGSGTAAQTTPFMPPPTNTQATPFAPPPPPPSTSTSLPLDPPSIPRLGTHLSSGPPPTSAPPAPAVAPPPPQHPEEDSDVASESQPAASDNSASDEDDEDDDDDDDDEDDEDDDDDDDEDEDDEEHRRRRWRAIEEDRSEPCDDELEYIKSRGEHSALDHKHWEDQTFFDLDDPELKPGESGRVEWVIEAYNGTKENPNVDLVMRSPTFKVGGLEWRLKVYPRGDKTEYISVYLECVTMHSSEFAACEEFKRPPFPFLTGLDNSMIKKRRVVAAQMSVVMYNPAEPRTNQFSCTAHQFHKGASDHGWRYFSKEPRDVFHLRLHGQRQAMLRNDKLAFSAYVRVVKDPTGCLWERSSSNDQYAESIATTGLRPFSQGWPHIAAVVPLLHSPLFRMFLYESETTSEQIHGLQTILLKVLSRQCSPQYGTRVEAPRAHAVTYLQSIARHLAKEGGRRMDPIIGPFEPDRGSAVGSNRLKVKGLGSIQAAVDKHPTALYTPMLLTMELERQEFDRKARKWRKIAHNIFLDPEIRVSGRKYYLYAFVTHCGDLQSNKHNVYVRPGGPGHPWYAYIDGRVTAYTSKQAMVLHSNTTESTAKQRVDSIYDIPSLDRLDANSEIIYALMYVRDDYTKIAFTYRKEEVWKVPDIIRENRPFPEDDKPAEREERPYHEQEGLGTALTAGAKGSGSDTPPWPLMDGDDVVMSDVEENEIHDSPVGGGLAASATLTLKANNGPPTAVVWSTTVDGIGQDFYSGGMLGDERHGKGHLIDLGGDEYVGQFRNGKYHGQGKMIYALTGNIYDGDWEDGQHHGQGVLTEVSTGNVYTGGWKYGRKHGSFVLKGVVTDEDKGCCTICYENDMTTAFYDCGHVVACKQCASMIDNCPVCRKPVQARMQIYGVKMTLE